MYGERNHQDMLQWDKTIGKVYYETNPKNKNEFRTVRVAWNPYSNTKYGQYSNYATGTPPDGMEAIAPLMISQLNRMPQSQPFF